MILHYGPSLEITTGAIVDAKFNKLPKEEKAAIQRWADQYGGNANREKEVQDRTVGEQVNILKWALGQNGGLVSCRRRHTSKSTLWLVRHRRARHFSAT